MATDDIRTTAPATFVLQDWLVEKLSVSSVPATRQQIAEKVTAEWANPVDLAFEQINEAFNGHAVRALRVGGGAFGGGTVTTLGTGAQRTQNLVLAKNIANGEFVHVGLTLRVALTTGTNAAVARQSALYKNTGGTLSQVAVDSSHVLSDPSDSLGWLSGATVVLPALPADVGSNTLALRVTGPGSGSGVVWSAEFAVSSGPSGLPANALI